MTPIEAPMSPMTCSIAARKLRFRLAPTEANGDEPVYPDRDQCRDYDQPTLDRLGMGEAARGFDRDEDDDHDQGGSVDRRSQDPDPVISVSALSVSRPLRLLDREPSQTEGNDVGKNVAGVRQQGQ